MNMALWKTGRYGAWRFPFNGKAFSQNIFAGGRFSLPDCYGVCAGVELNRDIRPILSDNCFYCHGPDGNHRKGKLRLDVREEALKNEAFVPGKPEESELVRRIFTDDKDDHMPPLESAKKLTEAQKATLKEWIAQGAKYEKHWADIPPTKAGRWRGMGSIFWCGRS